MQPPYDYIKDPDAIYAKSFTLVDAAIGQSTVPDGMHKIAQRLVHTCGDPSILQDLDYSSGFLQSAQRGLARSLFVDAEMVAAGITKRFLPEGLSPICSLNHEQTPTLAKQLGTTRSAAALELWGQAMEGSLVAIGNAPTALFHMLEGIQAQRFPRPAAVVGMAVGFVGAAESKQALAAFDLPYVTVHGTRGGSAMAASVVNAVAISMMA